MVARLQNSERYKPPLGQQGCVRGTGAPLPFGLVRFGSVRVAVRARACLRVCVEIYAHPSQSATRCVLGGIPGNISHEMTAHPFTPAPAAYMYHVHPLSTTRTPHPHLSPNTSCSSAKASGCSAALCMDYGCMYYFTVDITMTSRSAENRNFIPRVQHTKHCRSWLMRTHGIGLFNVGRRCHSNASNYSEQLPKAHLTTAGVWAPRR